MSQLAVRSMSIVGAVTACLSLLAACGPSAGKSPGTDAGPDAECIDGAKQCDADTFQTCQGGEWVTESACSGVCDANLGCVDCRPGVNFCVGDDVRGCDASGNETTTIETCSGGLHCAFGECADLCADAEESRSYIGCDYYALDLDNAIEVVGTPGLFGCGFIAPDSVTRTMMACADVNGAVSGLCEGANTCPTNFTCQSTAVCVLDAQGSPFAIVVSNPQGTPAQVTLSNQAGTTQTVTVNAGQVTPLFPQMMGFADQSLNGSGISPSAYRVTSDVPIVAYQFNPLDNVNVFSNDGSLLIPRHAFDSKYYALTWPTLDRRPQTNDYNGYVAVVAWEDGTEVQVTPAGAVRPSMGFAPMPAGVSQTFTLNAFDVLHFESAAGQDLSGTLVESSTGSVGVFAGHEAITIQNTSTSCCADHVEEMMFPTSTWGKDYVVARSKDRGKSEPDSIRIIAQVDGTSLSINPPVSPGCATLNAGQFCEFETMTDIEVSSSEPIMIGHYLQSVMEGGLFEPPSGTGDPALSIAVPTEQFRKSYTFLVPNQYAEQYISIVASAASAVTLDGADITGQLSSIGDGTWKTGRISVTPGQRQLDCSDGCGLEVYGYDSAVSYLFAGGLDLNQIVID